MAGSKPAGERNQHPARPRITLETENYGMGLAGTKRDCPPPMRDLNVIEATTPGKSDVPEVGVGRYGLQEIRYVL
jgi:hypothetical protein